MPNPAATVEAVWPWKMLKGEKEANVGLIFTDSTSTAKLDVVGRGCLKRTSRGHVLELTVPVQTPKEARQRVLALTTYVQNKVEDALHERLVVRCSPALSNEEVKRYLS